MEDVIIVLACNNVQYCFVYVIRTVGSLKKLDVLYSRISSTLIIWHDVIKFEFNKVCSERQHIPWNSTTCYRSGIKVNGCLEMPYRAVSFELTIV